MKAVKISSHGIGLSKALAAPKAPASELARIRVEWEKIEQNLGVTLTAPSTYDDNIASATLIQERVFPFLDQTGLIVSGDDLQHRFDLSIDGQAYCFSFREWGAYQAEWMNSNPAFRSLMSFEYIHFYMDSYVSGIFSDYLIYLDNLRIIRTSRTA